MNPISRKEARSQELKFYYTGKPCPKGHVAKRWVSTYVCYECHRERNAASSAKWRENNRDKARAASWKSNGMPEPTRPMPDVCECCGRPPNGRGMCLDHCHETREFRGWLCMSCNTGIGQLGDNIDGVKNAMRYLEEWFK